MSESGGISASSLAITEKKPQRSGGCAGLLFQLFDWNRRLAKKKLFSKKLLPPGRLKQGSKKFGGDEKQPKLRLIADENSGGFPNPGKSNKLCSVYPEKKHEMRSPGLVARLMGLDSMPAVPRDKPKKGEEKLEGEEPIFARMGARQDLRPQKLQKTGLSERRPVTRFGAEALQIKNMLSLSRKHHPKLASPVKSPRNVPGRSASRLIGVATKILEPGMQKSRGKYALTCSDTLAPGNYTSSTDALKATSCRNCGHSLNIVDSRANQEQESSEIPSPVLTYTQPCQDSETSVPLYFSHEQKERACEAGGRLEKKPISRGQIPQECELPNHSSYIGPMHKARKQNQMFLGRDRVPERARSGSLQSYSETKDFVALNKSLNGCPRTRSPTKAESCDFETERMFSNRRAESLSPVLKRRPMNANRQGKSSESSSVSNSTSGKETVHPIRKLQYPQEGDQNGSRHKFTFRSRVDQASSRENKGKMCSDSKGPPFALRGGTLGAILEQKLEELAFQEAEFGHLAEEGTMPRKSSAVILQELISALAAERQSHRNSGISRPPALAKVKCCKPLVTDLSNNITEVLQKIKLFYGHLKGSKLDYAKEVILNAELVLGNTARTSSSLHTSVSITCFLLEELETLTMRFRDILGFETAKHENQLKGFVFDCVLEFLDSKICVYSKRGIRAWTQLPPCRNTEMLVFEILEEVKLWMAMTGSIHDELLEWDMTQSMGKWTGFEIEVFEYGAEIGLQILQNLVDEVAIDLHFKQ